MRTLGQDHRGRGPGHSGMMAGLLAVAALAATARGFTVQVEEPDGTPVSGFHWTLEEDNTNQPEPGVGTADALAVSIHKSHAPVVASGYSGASSAAIDVPDPLKAYFVSVLPDAGHTLTGARIEPGFAGTVTTVTNPFKVPTAQITILVFHDNATLNNGPDAGFEEGLAGFDVIIHDAAGQLMQDVFGNPLGTTYKFVNGEPRVDVMGDGVIKTDQAGRAAIKYIAPGKYGVQVIPPPGEGWMQVTTIEGTKTIDAWVKANEGSLLVEFGPALQHIFVGFIKETNILSQLPTNGLPTGSVTGRVVYNHTARPPVVQGFFSGPPVPKALVALNDLTSRQCVYAGHCDPDTGEFVISGVPAGMYQLAVWDENLDVIITFYTIVMPGAEGSYDVDLGDVLVFAWFARLEGSVFYDANRNGFRDANEGGIPDQAVNIRFRDGRIYQATATDPYGDYSFDEVFPFFKWLIAEVDFLRFRDTGYTNVVDYGGQIPPDNGWAMPSRGVLNPQPQAADNPNTGNNLSRTEADPNEPPGAFLLQAFQSYAGQTNIAEWGKVNYGLTESGGVSGVVHYAITRAEDDPAFAVGEEWEPGVPRVQINLYQDFDNDTFIDDLDSNPGPTLADRDNHPLGWADGTEPRGDEDVDWNDDGVFDPGDAIQIVWTDSFDDNPPTGCIQDLPVVHGQIATECFDNFGTWNQMRPGVFDGGWAIASHVPGGIASGNPETDGLPPGIYVVEAATPAGYEVVKEEDKNVDYGDEFEPGMLALPELPPPCVGEDHEVPPFLSLRTNDPAQQIPAPFAGETRRLCDRKQVVHLYGQNTAVNFFVFTYAPKAARAVGIINNDLAAEGDPNSPLFGEKQPPSWIPISFRDWAGNELVRVYSDEYGAYNALLPSSFTANLPSPTGVMPHMITLRLNDPGPIPDPDNPGQFIVDPRFDPSYSQTAYTFNFESGATTYLDTPVIPVAAFVGFPNRVLDGEPPAGTPVIYSVMGPQGGPLVCADGDELIIRSVGTIEVANPDHNPADPGSPLTVMRDLGFGANQGDGEVTVDGVSLDVTSWSDLEIRATVDTSLVSTGQLIVTRHNGRSTLPGITLHVGGCADVVHVTGGSNYPEKKIQDAIDNAPAGTLIIVEPGTYNENPIIWKHVKVQGSGAGSTSVNGNPMPGARVPEWHAALDSRIAGGDVEPTDPANAALFFTSIEAPAFFILARPATFDSGARGLIDGFRVFGAVGGGGIYINGHADYFEVSNNLVVNNQGTFGGGITVGTGVIAIVGAEPDSDNDFVSIHHNRVIKNGGINGGGGISILRGADGYAIANNVVLGNFTRFVGGGIAHLGVSHGGTIENNTIAFNEVFYGGQIGGDGGGVYIGASGAGPQNPGGLGAGTGSVTIDANLIHGNLAGSGAGGGIAALGVNGEEVGPDPAEWYALNIFNNRIVNNVAAYRAGGISLQHVAMASILHNTIANNDSTGTAALAFPGGDIVESTPQGAGIVAGQHSEALAAATGQAFSNPLLVNNILWHNRSFGWNGALNGGTGALVPNAPTYWDLAVVGGGQMDPQYCVLSDATGYSGTNLTVDPQFVEEYSNNLVAAPLLEEGGNSVTVRFTNLTLQAADYHIENGSPAVNAGIGGYVGQFPALASDCDGNERPMSGGYDIGADEVNGAIQQLGGTAGNMDFDADGDVDLGDFLMFQACFNGPNRPAAGPNCGGADLDTDSDVDLGDFFMFQACFNGPNRAPACEG